MYRIMTGSLQFRRRRAVDIPSCMYQLLIFFLALRHQIRIDLSRKYPVFQMDVSSDSDILPRISPLSPYFS